MAVSAVTHILCPVDFSEFAHRALDHAAALALWYKAPLTVLHVCTNLLLDLGPDVPVPHLPDSRQREDDLRQFVKGLPPEIALNLLIRQTRDAQDEIVTHAEALKADFLVMGSHGRSGFKHLLLGSVAEAVMRRSPRPVMIVPHAAPDANAAAPVRFSHILCATDLSESSMHALHYALDLAQKAGAHVTLLHAIEVPPEFRENRMAEDFDVDRVRAAAEARFLERLRAAIPSTAQISDHVETVVVEGRADHQVLRHATARNVDLIVMGRHGHGAVNRLLFGSNTQEVVRAATCPVLVVGGSGSSASE